MYKRKVEKLNKQGMENSKCLHFAQREIRVQTNQREDLFKAGKLDHSCAVRDVSGCVDRVGVVFLQCGGDGLPNGLNGNAENVWIGCRDSSNI